MLSLLSSNYPAFYNQFINVYDSIASYLVNNTPLLYFTQSLWRDEAFSVLVASPGGIETIKITAADYNTPLYYLTLHYWMIIFGKSEVSIRSLSFIFFGFFLLVFYNFAKKILPGKWSLIALLTAAFNPMLVYYGFEARMYSLYALTTTASMYYFYMKKWKFYILFTTLALYTHSYTVFVPLTQFFYLIISKKITKENLKYLLIPFIFYSPWIPVIIDQLKRSKEMWIYPVNIKLVFAAVSNLLTGYEGTPGFLWGYMIIFSFVVILIFLSFYIFNRKVQEKTLFLLWVFLPLVIILSLSILKPLFVNRYLITISVAEVMLLILGIYSLPWKRVRIVTAFLFLSISTFYLFYIPKYIKKVDIRNTFFLVNNLVKDDDLILPNSPLVFFESVYYSKNPQNVFLYNPNKIRLPNYLGNVLIPVEKQIDKLPKLPKRAFLINEDGSFNFYSSLTQL